MDENKRDLPRRRKNKDHTRRPAGNPIDLMQIELNRILIPAWKAKGPPLRIYDFLQIGKKSSSLCFEIDHRERFLRFKIKATWLMLGHSIFAPDIAINLCHQQHRNWRGSFKGWCTPTPLSRHRFQIWMWENTMNYSNHDLLGKRHKKRRSNGFNDHLLDWWFTPS